MAQQPSNGEAQVNLILLSLAIAELTLTGDTFIDPMKVLPMLSPSEMSVNELEEESKALKEILAIFKGQGPGDRIFTSSFQPVIDMYEARIRAVDAEILERSLLQYS